MAEKNGKSSMDSHTNAAIFFEQCIGALKGPGDEHRFVGLLLLAKLLPKLKGDKPLMQTLREVSTVPVRRQIFDAVGPLFLRRLFMAKTKSSEEKTEDYRELALLVLSFLLEDENVAKVFVDFSDRFFLNLYMETTSILETLKCLVAVCKVSPKHVSMHLIASNCPDKVHFEVDGKKYNHLSYLCEGILLNKKYEANVAVRRSAMYLLYNLINSHRGKVIFDERIFTQCVGACSIIFATVTQDTTVFDAVACLALLFQPTRSDDTIEERKLNSLMKSINGKKGGNRTWQSNIFKGLTNMLKSKIPLDTRGKLFPIIHFMLVHEGQSWGLGKDLVSTKERTVEDAQKLKDLFPMVVAKSTMIEARVNMDIIARIVIDQALDDGESDQLGLNKLGILESCYGIVERCIQFLVDEEEGAYKWNSLKPSTLLCLRDSFVDIVQTAIGLLKYFEKARKDGGSNITDGGHIVMLEIIFRLLSTWLSVDAVSVAETLLNNMLAIEHVILSLDPKVPKHRVVMEYSLPTLTILLEDYNAIIEINDNRKMVDKILELDFESKRRQELLGDNLADGKDESIFIKRLLRQLQGGSS